MTARTKTIERLEGEEGRVIGIKVNFDDTKDVVIVCCHIDPSLNTGEKKKRCIK